MKIDLSGNVKIATRASYADVNNSIRDLDLRKADKTALVAKADQSEVDTKASITYVDEVVSKMEVLKYTASGIADSKRSFDVTGLEDDMVPLVMDLSNPSAQTSGWTISTTTNNFTITGTISGTTDADFYFVKTR